MVILFASKKANICYHSGSSVYLSTSCTSLWISVSLQIMVWCSW